MKTYSISEVFKSLQGEGARTGTANIFVRFAGCNLRCAWCDQPEAIYRRAGTETSLEELVQEIARAAGPIRHIILTGGEPALQWDRDLFSRLTALQRNFIFAMETNGTLPLRAYVDWVTISPKFGFKLDPQTLHEASELKFIVDEAFDFEWAQDIASKVPHNTIRLLQPEWGTPASVQRAIDLVLEYPTWRLSLQTHKYLNIR